MIDKVILKTNTGDLIINSHSVYYDKRIRDDIKKTSISINFSEEEYQSNKDLIERVMKLTFSDVESIYFNDRVIEDEINNSYKSLQTFFSNLNLITNEIESDKHFLHIVLEYSNGDSND